MSRLMVAVVGLMCLTAPAYAKTTRHCVDKDNKEISASPAKGQSAAKACKAAGGKWMKMKVAKTKTK